MSQKANLLTIRKKNRIELITHNSKLWVSLYILIENLGRLFFIKGIWLFKSFSGFDTNLVYLYLFLYYQNSKVSLYKRKFITKKNNFSILVPNKNFLKIFQKYISIFGYNIFNIKMFNLNILVNKKKISFLFNQLKIFSSNIFSRRFNLFIDFIKITVLFLDNHIDLMGYIKVWSRIFKYLSKRMHSKFFLFVKTLINSLMQMKNVFKFQNIEKNIKQLCGVKFLLSGRIRGKARASSNLIQIGTIPIQSIDKTIDFASCHVCTLYGVFGIKIWVYLKKN